MNIAKAVFMPYRVVEVYADPVFSAGREATSRHAIEPWEDPEFNVLEYVDLKLLEGLAIDGVGYNDVEAPLGYDGADENTWAYEKPSVLSMYEDAEDPKEAYIILERNGNKRIVDLRTSEPPKIKEIAYGTRISVIPVGDDGAD